MEKRYIHLNAEFQRIARRDKIAFLSDQCKEIENRGRSACVTTHVAGLEFPREHSLILRCAGKAVNPFQTTQGNRLSCRVPEGRRVSDETVPGHSVFASREHIVSRNFWVSQVGCQGPFHPSGRNRGLPLHCPFVLCLHPQGCLRRDVRASGSYLEWTGNSGSFSIWHQP